jgi:glucuronate isomerase
LQAVSGVAISSFDTFLDALKKRHDFFHQVGCRVSDHGLEQIVAEPHTAKQIEDIFAKARAKRALAPIERDQFRSAMLYELAIMDHASGWTQQFHLGAMRNNSTRVMRTLGPDTGFDSIGDYPQAAGLARLLDRLDSTNQLCKSIIYNLNPADNEVVATMLGNFQDGSCPGKMQFGAAWWFMDQKDGMERQMNALSALGLLSRFVGMLTDSRSFLSYSRHAGCCATCWETTSRTGSSLATWTCSATWCGTSASATRASTSASSPGPRSGDGNSMAAGGVCGARGRMQNRQPTP